MDNRILRDVFGRYKYSNLYDYLNNHRAYDLVLEEYMEQNAMEVLTYILQWEKVVVRERYTVDGVCHNEEGWGYFTLRGLFKKSNDRYYLYDIEDLMLMHGFKITK